MRGKKDIRINNLEQNAVLHMECRRAFRETIVMWTRTPRQGQPKTKTTLMHSGLASDLGDVDGSWSYFIRIFC